MDSSSFSALKVDELRALCRSKGLDASGRKNELIKRLTDFSTGQDATASTVDLEVNGPSKPQAEGAVAAFATEYVAAVGGAAEAAESTLPPPPEATNLTTQDGPQPSTGQVAAPNEAPSQGGARADSNADWADRLAKRAQRFGVTSNEAQKLSIRAKRFGVVSGPDCTSANPSSGGSAKDIIACIGQQVSADETALREARAKRFGLPKKAEELLEARAKRFGIGGGDDEKRRKLEGHQQTPKKEDDASWQAVLEQRKLRFTGAPTTYVNKTSEDAS